MVWDARAGWEPSFQCQHTNGSRLTDRCWDGRADHCAVITFNTSYSTVVTEVGHTAQEVLTDRGLHGS